MHVAVICDGNRRWAKENGLSTKEGYKKGIEVVKIIAEEAIRLKIQHLTLFVLSTENVNRTATWLSIFKELIREHLKSMAMDAIKKGCKISFLGNQDILGYEIGDLLRDIAKTEPKERKLFLNFCFGYSGRHGLQRQCKKLFF